MEDAVAEVEDVAGAVGGLIEDLFSAAANGLFVGEEDERVEIALNSFCLADDFPGIVEADAPVDTDYLSAGFGEKRQEGGVAGGEVDDGNARS